MSDPTIDAIRQSVPDDRATTHWAGCEVSHRWCAIRYLLDHLTVAEQARHQAEQERDEWRDAIIDACVVDWIFTKEHETNPRKAVNDLLSWQQDIALNPAVSKEAHNLHERADKAEAELTALRATFTGFIQERDEIRTSLGLLAGGIGLTLPQEVANVIRERDTLRATVTRLRERVAAVEREMRHPLWNGQRRMPVSSHDVSEWADDLAAVLHADQTTETP